MKKVLIVDDSLFSCKVIAEILSKENLCLITAHLGKHVLETALAEKPDLILLNIVLPDLNGYQVCAILKKDPRTKHIPVVFITAKSDVNSIVTGFESGAIDYIPKPFSSHELRARVMSHIKTQEITEQLRITNKELATALMENRLLATKDPLTKLFNRRHLLESLERLKAQALAGHPFTLLLADVDDFKQINDFYGHCAGDYTLYTIADLLTIACAKTDIIGRWGGEEFLIILPDQALDQATDVAQTIRQGIANYPFHYDGHDLSCTLTIGITPFNPQFTITENIACVDTALYEGKRSTKNCCSTRAL